MKPHEKAEVPTGVIIGSVIAGIILLLALVAVLWKVRKFSCLNHRVPGRLGGSVVEGLPLAQVVIPGSRDGIPHRVPRREPASPSAYVSVSLMNK